MFFIEIKNSADIEYNKDDDTVKFVFKDEITVWYILNITNCIFKIFLYFQEESGVLSMAFVGILRDDMEGFYKIKYKVDEEEKLSAATQFEVIYFDLSKNSFNIADCISI